MSCLGRGRGGDAGRGGGRGQRSSGGGGWSSSRKGGLDFDDSIDGPVVSSYLDDDDYQSGNSGVSSRGHHRGHHSHISQSGSSSSSKFGDGRSVCISLIIIHIQNQFGFYIQGVLKVSV